MPAATRRTAVTLAAVLAFPAGLAAVGAFVDGPASAATAPGATAVSEFVATNPERVLNSRSGVGTSPGQKRGDVTLTVPVPDGTTAVTLNVTVARPTATGYVRVWATGATEPPTSNVNFTRGQTQANLVTTKVSANRQVTLKVSGASVDLFADLTGYYVPAPTTSGSPTSGGGNPICANLPQLPICNLGGGSSSSSASPSPSASSTAAPGANQQPTAPSDYVAQTPTRFVDSRYGTGTSQGRKRGPVTITLPSTVPANATAVALNVTAANALGAGHVAVYPAGTSNPGTSSVNYTAGIVQANLVTTKIGSNRQVTLDVAGSAADLIVDALGYYAPARGSGSSASASPSGSASASGSSSPSASASRSGSASASSSASPSASASSGCSLPVICAPADGAAMTAAQSSGTTYAEGDSAPSDFVAQDAARFVDSRYGTGVPQGQKRGEVTFTLPDTVPSDATAVALNVTVTNPTARGYASVYPAGRANPGTSNVNFLAKQTQANLVYVQVGTDRKVTAFVGGASADLIVDISGYFLPNGSASGRPSGSSSASATSSASRSASGSPSGSASASGSASGSPSGSASSTSGGGFPTIIPAPRP